MLKHYINKDLCILHVQLKGPKSALYYRGEGYISDVNTGVTIELPKYVDKLVDDFSIYINPIYNGGKIRTLNSSKIFENKFIVYGEEGPFYWLVFGRKEQIKVEINKSDLVNTNVELHRCEINNNQP